MVVYLAPLLAVVEPVTSKSSAPSKWSAALWAIDVLLKLAQLDSADSKLFPGLGRW